MNRADDQIRDQLTDEMTKASIDKRNLSGEVIDEAVIITGAVPDSTDGRGRWPVTGTSADSRHKSRDHIAAK